MELHSRLVALEEILADLNAMDQRLQRLEAGWGAFLASAMGVYTATAATGAEMGTARASTGAEETGAATAATGAEESGRATAASATEETAPTPAEERATPTAWQLSIWRRAADGSWNLDERLEF